MCTIRKLFISEQKEGKEPFQRSFSTTFSLADLKNDTLEVKWVPSSQNLADPLSRRGQDSGGLHLGQKNDSSSWKRFPTLHHIPNRSFCRPRKQNLANFTSRWQHWEAKVTCALRCHLESLGKLYANLTWFNIH